MRDGNGTCQLMDMLQEDSIRCVVVQQSNFRRFLARGGADALIAGLWRKITGVSNGAPRS
jgi:phospholipid transport system substrate-binding protein